jgi:hypothetical protein
VWLSSAAQIHRRGKEFTTGHGNAIAAASKSDAYDAFADLEWARSSARPAGNGAKKEKGPGRAEPRIGDNYSR